MSDRLAAFAALMEAEWRNGHMPEATYLRLNADLAGVTLDPPVRGDLARAWKRRAKMYKGLYRRYLNETADWKAALRAAGIGQMMDLNPEAIRLTITVPTEKRINEMVEERIAARLVTLDPPVPDPTLQPQEYQRIFADPRPAPDTALREAAQAVVEAWDANDLTLGWNGTTDFVDALRAALEAKR